MSTPKQVLRQLIADYGLELVNQPNRVKGLLMDFCSGHKGEVKLLATIAENGMAKKLLLDGGKNLSVLIPQFADQLHEAYCFDRPLSHWALESWAESLFNVSLKEQAFTAGNLAILSDFSSYEQGVAEEVPNVANITWTEPVTGMEFVWVPGGTFEMGDVFDDGMYNEKPVHNVTLKGFLLGRYPVTQAQWQKIMGDNPLLVDKGDDYPVESVSWNIVQDFIKALNARGSAKFRLPSEAQWEYACRSGGKREKYSGGSDAGRVAWYEENSHSFPPVGRKAPNGLGLHDMSGNVWEWVEDRWHDNYNGAPIDGSAWVSGDDLEKRVKLRAWPWLETSAHQDREFGMRVIRGGEWGDCISHTRCSSRHSAQEASASAGFRLLSLR